MFLRPSLTVGAPIIALMSHYVSYPVPVPGPDRKEGLLHISDIYNLETAYILCLVQGLFLMCSSILGETSRRTSLSERDL